MDIRISRPILRISLLVPVVTENANLSIRGIMTD